MALDLVSRSVLQRPSSCWSSCSFRPTFMRLFMLAFIRDARNPQLLVACTRGSIRAFASKASADTGTEEEQRHTREWLSRLNAETIPRRLGEVSFSRSSGPGGQNVNKYEILNSMNFLVLIPYQESTQKPP